MFRKISYKVQSFFDNIFEPYELSSEYSIMIRDKISGDKFAVSDWIYELDKRVQYLEDELVWTKSELVRLSEESIESSNSLYEIANNIESRIDIIGSECYKLPMDVEKLQ
jgi:hypothetical protein